uniref:HpcH/HpaI aldolase/citrate lyase domain-containing protein n=1 Tax=Timema monikensis TaxID=170555 RepID=A0A7R9ECG2_9NEOP|nr:unnamed protein product [Timema monikensis]
MSGCQKINLIMYIESARAVLNLPHICRKTEQLSSTAPFKPAALVFGSDDLCASLGVTRSDDGTEILYARQKLVLVAKAFHLQAIDMVHINFQACASVQHSGQIVDLIPDMDGLRKQSEAGARMGYTGKQVIHPGQIPIVQQAFMPAPATVEWAEGLIAAFQEHQKIGKVRFYAYPFTKQGQGRLRWYGRGEGGGLEAERKTQGQVERRGRTLVGGRKLMEGQMFEAVHGYDDENQRSWNQRVEAKWSGFLSDPMDGVTREDPD